jgi:methylated-DNA-[protein]-cysteine S-methyltransferase
VIEYDVIPTPIGPCTVVMEGGRILRLYLGRLRGEPGVRTRLTEARRWISDWFRGKPVKPRLKLEGSEFALRVYDALRRIPPGKTLTYGEVARRAGRAGAARAAGRAISSNRICLFIP